MVQPGLLQARGVCVCAPVDSDDCFGLEARQPHWRTPTTGTRLRQHTQLHAIPRRAGTYRPASAMPGANTPAPSATCHSCCGRPAAPWHRAASAPAAGPAEAHGCPKSPPCATNTPPSHDHTKNMHASSTGRSARGVMGCGQRLPCQHCHTCNAAYATSAPATPGVAPGVCCAACWAHTSIHARPTITAAPPHNQPSTLQ
jgi:hypothetical protein